MKTCFAGVALSNGFIGCIMNHKDGKIPDVAFP